VGGGAGAPEAILDLAPLIQPTAHLGSQFPGRWEDFAEGLGHWVGVPERQDSRASDAQANHRIWSSPAGLTLFWESGSGSLGRWDAGTMEGGKRGWIIGRSRSHRPCRNSTGATVQ
jgi:hypothetical protein